MNGEVFVGTAEAGNEVVLEHMDDSLGSIVAVEVWQNELVVNTFGGQANGPAEHRTLHCPSVVVWGVVPQCRVGYVQLCRH